MVYSTRKVIIALLIAQSMVLSIFESLIPVNFVFPGIKLGFANIIIIIALYFLEVRYVYFIVIARVVLTSLFSGNIIMFLFSITGGLLSVSIMAVMIMTMKKYFSPVGLSFAGAFFHNIGQILVAFFIVKDLSIFFLLPYFTVAAIITGFITGYISKYLIDNLDGVIDINLSKS